MASAQAADDQAQANAAAAKAKLDQVRAATSIAADVAQADSNLAAAAARLETAYQNLDQLAAQLAQANADLAATEASASSARKTADQTCRKLGGSSAECAAAKSHIVELQPRILQIQNTIKLLKGDGSWDHLAATKDLDAAQQNYTAAAATLKQTEAARAVAADLVSAQSNYPRRSRASHVLKRRSINRACRPRPSLRPPRRTSTRPRQDWSTPGPSSTK